MNLGPYLGMQRRSKARLGSYRVSDTFDDEAAREAQLTAKQDRSSSRRLENFSPKLRSIDLR